MRCQGIDDGERCTRRTGTLYRVVRPTSRYSELWLCLHHLTIEQDKGYQCHPVRSINPETYEGADTNADPPSK